MEKNVFIGCTGIKSLTIPDSVKTIGSDAFYHIGTIYYYGDGIQSEGEFSTPQSNWNKWGAHLRNPKYIEGDFCYWDSYKTYIMGYVGTDGNVTIPSGKVMTNEAFRGDTSLKSVRVECDYVSSSGFEDCENIEKVEITENCNSISPRAFIGCTKLKDLILPDSLYIIGDAAFAYCTSLKEINIPFVEYTSSGDGYWKQFSNCTSLEKVTIAEGNEFLWLYGFSDCVNLKEVTLPESLSLINQGLFENCTSLEQITIPEGATEILDEAFFGCSNLVITIPDTVTDIGEVAFFGVKHVYYNGTADGSPWDALDYN